MRSRFLRVVALAVATSLLSTGCMLSRAVDRAFLGISIRRPTYVDRKTTGVFLLPFTFAFDIATFPIQAILVVILGDQFPFHDRDPLTGGGFALNDNPQFQKLNADQKAIAIAELNELLRSGTVTANTALALLESGHWVVVPLTADTRDQLIARAQSLQSAQMVCAAP
jgi:hypothetical protein